MFLIRLTTLLLIFNISEVQATTRCIDVFQKTISNQAALRVEHLFGQTTMVKDLSLSITERTSFKSPDIQVIDYSEAFSSQDVLLGFGRPNVFLTFPKEGDSPARFAAKSLYRADSVIEDTKGRIQSGVFLVFKDMNQEMLDRLYKSAQQHEGTRQWTCVNANCRVLQDAGFTSGDRPLDKIYFPVSLLKTTLRNGIQFEGQDIEYELVRTTPSYLEKFGLSVIKAQWLTLFRHGQRAVNGLAEKNSIVANIVKIKNKTKSYLGIWLVKENKPESVSIEPIVSLEHVNEAGPTYDLSVSKPTQFGMLLRLLWGPHSFFEVTSERVNVNEYLPDPLKEFPQENPDFVTKIKKKFLFSKPVVATIHSQLSKSYENFKDVEQSQLFSMLRASYAEVEHKYNIVITGKRIIIMKIDVGEKYPDWVLSKHVLLANYSEGVRFAGEVWKTEDGIIRINNNSGTYQPTNLHLDKAIEYLTELFPNVQIQGESM